MRTYLLLSITLLGTFALAQETAQQPSGSTAPESKVLQLKGFDAGLMDKTADPCVDFYQYSCGGWLKANPVPADQSSYGRDTELAERNRLILRDILEKASVNDPKRSAVDQKIGDFYSTCMDEAGINAKGAAPLKSTLDRIANIKDRAEVSAAMIDLFKDGISPFFRFGPSPEIGRAHV